MADEMVEIDGLTNLQNFVSASRGPRVVQIRSLRVIDCPPALVLLQRLSRHHRWNVVGIERVQNAARVAEHLRALTTVDIPRILAQLTDPPEENDGDATRYATPEKPNPIDVVNDYRIREIQMGAGSFLAGAVVDESRKLLRLWNELYDHFVSDWPFRHLVEPVDSKVKSMREMVFEFYPAPPVRSR